MLEVHCRKCSKVFSKPEDFEKHNENVHKNKTDQGTSNKKHKLAFIRIDL